MSNCIFCKIAEKEIPSTVVYENEDVICFRDIHPVAPTHILIVPKVHHDSLLALSQSPDYSHVMGAVCKAAAEVAKLEGLEEKGFRLINNCGKDGGQTVMHLHFHLIGGVSLGEALI